MIPTRLSFLEIDKQDKVPPHELMKSLECSVDVETPA